MCGCGLVFLDGVLEVRVIDLFDHLTTADISRPIRLAWTWGDVAPAQDNTHTLSSVQFRSRATTRGLVEGVWYEIR
jgi:hypothetical protein